MRIAQVAPLAEAVPPKLYGGTERVVSWLTEELVQQGHDVTLFASGDSITQARLEAATPRGLRLAGIKDHTASMLVMLNDIRDGIDEFDVVHFHIDLLQYPLFRNDFRKCLTTLHGRLDLVDYHPIYRAFPDMPLVSISDHQRLPMPPVNWVRTIYHGLPSNLHPFNPRGGEYLAFLGRIAPEKRPDRAIEIAKRSGIPLKIAAKVDPADEDYFVAEIEPLLKHPLIEYVGEINDGQKAEFLGNALALLFPIDWPEPFGLVMIESMSCGTPIIAWNNGSVPEVIDHGFSGMIVSSITEAVVAAINAKALDRSVVRNCFESRFCSSNMAASYLDVYRQLTQQARGHPPKVPRLPSHLAPPFVQRGLSENRPPATSQSGCDSVLIP
jgi:glycosyltransferase involved in cell wall biosynthesis